MRYSIPDDCWQVFHYQQSRVVSFKEEVNQQQDVNTDDDQIEDDSDDVLLRVSGAQLH